MARMHVPGRRSRKGFTLLELLVVIAIIGIIFGLLLVAIQQVRQSSSRAECTNNLRQLTLAVQQYNTAHGQFPAGAVKYRHYDDKGNRVEYDRHTWCLLVLPYIERNDLYSRWVFQCNGPPGAVGGAKGQYVLPNEGDLATNAVASQPIKTLLCPSDPAIGSTTPYGVTTETTVVYTSTWSATDGFGQIPPGDPGYAQWGITSYQGNGGTASYGVLKEYAGNAKNAKGFKSGQNGSRDGTMYLWQHFDDPTGAYFIDLRYKVTIASITDGASNTLLLGEKSLFDRDYEANCSAYQQPLIMLCRWANPTGLDVYAGTEFPLNASFKQLDTMFDNGCYGGGDATSCACKARASNFSSNHSGGVNFAFCDGSVRFIRQTIPVETLRALSTRAGGEVIDASAF